MPKEKKLLKYIFSALLITWGFLIGWFKLFTTGPHFPFLTFLTITAVVTGVKKYNPANTLFFLSGCAWMVFSFETIGFIIFSGSGNYERMILPIIPLFISFLLILFTQVHHQAVNSRIKKTALIPLFTLLGIGSYVYKTTVEEVNCWYYINDSKTYNVRFAKTPNRTFEVNLSSDELKNQVTIEGLQYEGRNGYYCPETKIRVTTNFSQITSAKILSFRNSKIDKKVTFSNPITIPLDKAKGKIEILKPYLWRLWN